MIDFPASGTSGKLETPKGIGAFLKKKFWSALIYCVNSNKILKLTVLFTDGTNVIGSQDAEIKSTDNGMVITLPPVMLPAPTVSGLRFRNLWTISSPPDGLGNYMTGDIVILQTGTATGTYISTVDNNFVSPDTGTGWVQIATTLGQWQ